MGAASASPPVEAPSSVISPLRCRCEEEVARLQGGLGVAGKEMTMRHQRLVLLWVLRLQKVASDPCRPRLATL